MNIDIWKDFTIENVKNSQKFKIQSCSNGQNCSFGLQNQTNWFHVKSKWQKNYNFHIAYYSHLGCPGLYTLLIMGVFHEWIFFWKIMVPAIWTIHALSETPWSLASKPRAWRVRAIFLFLSTRFVEIVLIHVCHFGLVVFLIFGIYLDIWELSRYLGVFGIFGNHLNILYSIEHSWAWQSPV